MTDWIRPLPGTSLQVSAVTLGGAPLGSMPEAFGYDVPSERALAVIRAVLASRIRTIDTSNGYSDGESERRIGAGIAAAGGLPDDVLVITKVDPRDGDYSGDRVRASVAESQERLGLDHLPLVHLHDPEFHAFETMTEPGGAVDALVALRESGVVGAIGVAGGDVHEIGRYVDLGVFDVLLTHNRWTLVDRSAGPLIENAVGRGMGVLNAAVYGGGILARMDDTLTTYGYREAPAEVLDAVRSLRTLCTRFGTDLSTAALQWSLRDERIASTVVGLSRPERIGPVLQAADAVLPEEFWAEAETLVPPAGVWLDAR